MSHSFYPGKSMIRKTVNEPDIKLHIIFQHFKNYDNTHHVQRKDNSVLNFVLQFII